MPDPGDGHHINSMGNCCDSVATIVSALHRQLSSLVKAEQEASGPLSVTVDVSRGERVTAGIGKCSVCGLVRDEWIDREAEVKLCEHCYGRGVRENARGVGVV